MRQKASFIWITDPWESLDHKRDTTLRLASEAASLGFNSHWCDFKSIVLNNGVVTADIYPIDQHGTRSLECEHSQALGKFTSIHYRVDPPVDLAYLHFLHLVTLAASQSDGSTAEIVNPPNILTSLGEKLLCHLLPDFTPPTVVTCNPVLLQEFGELFQITVAKPLHSAQSKGVQVLSWANPETSARSLGALSHLSDEFRRPVLLQKFLAEISEGETRVWYLDGMPIATAKKVPSQGSAVIDIDKGDSIVPTTLTARQKQIVTEVGAALRSRSVRMAAVDMIGTYVTDFNVTSPGLLCQLETVVGSNLARLIIQTLTTSVK